MRLAIIGLPASGKTTVFDLLTGGARAPAGHTSDGAFQLRVAEVPDARLDYLAQMFPEKKHTPATMEFADVAWRHARTESTLAYLREADGLVKVLRAFTSAVAPHPKGSVDVMRDFQEIESELLIADLGIVEKRVHKLESSLKRPSHTRQQDLKELELMKRCTEGLENGKRIRELPFTETERLAFRPFQFLSEKPSIVLVNCDEEEAAKPDAAKSFEGKADMALAVSAEIEKELGELPPDDRKEFMATYGLKELHAPTLVQSCRRALGLGTFLTTEHEEVRAWNFRIGEDIVAVAGRIHTDMAEHFIRAEVVHFDDLKEAGSLKEARSRGKARLEGRGYAVQDGDIVSIRFGH